MKHPPLLLLSLFFAGSTFSQPVNSPEVHSDGRVTFRLRAPNAETVRVQCEGLKSANMEKDAQGVWSWTCDALEPDYYGYSFYVDSARVIDPSNPLLKYNLLNTENQVHVSGPATLPWELNDVPRGELHRHYYRSKITEDDRDFIVYTPPGYDPAGKTRYPVLYLLHGFSDDATGWTSAGLANVILDNLIARKDVKPMIVVMPLGYGMMTFVRGGSDAARRAEMRQQNTERFQGNLFKEVMPMAEKEYRIMAEQKTRAIAGLSMGGAQSLSLGLNNLDRFAWVGAFSAGGGGTNYVSQFPRLNLKANDKLMLLWIGCGKEDGLFAGNKKFEEWLTSEGVKHIWKESPGAHSWRVWRRYLAELTPLLFQDKK
jgi:enterochelin esterase family protein